MKDCWSYTFLKNIKLCEIPTVLFRIWTWETKSTSGDNDHYATSVSFKKRGIYSQFKYKAPKSSCLPCQPNGIKVQQDIDWSERRIVEFIPIPKVLVLCEMQSRPKFELGSLCSDNNYAMNASLTAIKRLVPFYSILTQRLWNLN